MSGTSQLSAPGSSTYDSNTLHVGDGTWVAGRDDFLLPNLVGLNFATMQYNGMANRFRGLSEYHTLILGHGILAAMTFLFIVPAAIFVLRFGPFEFDARFAVRIHVWLQILTVFLSTVILALGWFAVGPNRSLTNPHHGIGIAIYVLVLFQAMWGYFVRHRERGRTLWRISLKLMFHQWLGRATALLAIAQIPLGLVLYGSPKSLFIVYALWMFTLVALWFVFSHRYQGDRGVDDRSYFSGTRRTDVSGDDRRSRHGGGGLLGALALGGLGAAALGMFRKRRDSVDGSRDDRTDITERRHDRASRHDRDSQLDSQRSSFIDEKAGGHRREHTLRDRILGTVGIATAVGLASRWFGKRNQRDDMSGTHTMSDVSDGRYTASRTDISRMEEGRRPTTPLNDQNRRTDESTALGPNDGSPSRPSRFRNRRSGGSILTDDVTESFASPGRDKRQSHGVRNSIAAMGLGAYLMSRFRRGRNQREEDRIEDLREQDERAERLQRRSSLSGGGRRYGGRRRDDDLDEGDSRFTESDATPFGQSTPGVSHHNVARPVAAAAAGAALGAAAVGVAHHMRHGSRTQADGSSVHDVRQSAQSLGGSGGRRPPPPQYGGAGGPIHESSADESWRSHGDSGGRRSHHRLAEGAAAAAGLAAGAAGGAALADHNRRRSDARQQQQQQRPPSIGSPPLSLEFRMASNDGRQNVTLRRLNPQEAARLRNEGRAGSGSRPPPGASISSLGGTEAEQQRRDEDERWRRAEAGGGGGGGGAESTVSPLPQAQAVYNPPPPPPPDFYGGVAGPAATAQQGSSSPAGPPPPPPPPPGGQPFDLSPPPPVGMGGGYDTGGSATGSRAESNRRRRRAERARMEQAGRDGRGSRVEFE